MNCSPSIISVFGHLNLTLCAGDALVPGTCHGSVELTIGDSTVKPQGVYRSFTRSNYCSLFASTQNYWDTCVLLHACEIYPAFKFLAYSSAMSSLLA